MSMKMILGICGSPRRDRNTETLLSKALEGAKGLDIETELISLGGLNILPCQGCNTCIKEKICPLDDEDDMPIVKEKLTQADGIVLASPSYFGGPPGVMKNMMDRTRSLKMDGHRLKNKIVSSLAVSGLRHGAAEQVNEALIRFALTHGMIVVGGCENPVNMSHFAVATLQSDKGWRRSKDDEIAMANAATVGRRVAEIVLALDK